MPAKFGQKSIYLNRNTMFGGVNVLSLMPHAEMSSTKKACIGHNKMECSHNVINHTRAFPAATCQNVPCEIGIFHFMV